MEQKSTQRETRAHQPRQRMTRGSRIAVNYATITSSLALVIALGGVGWAAATLPRNSVGTPQLKEAAVTTPKVKRNAITGAKVRDHSLHRADLAPGALEVELTHVASDPRPVTPGATGSAEATCPAGMEATGGGAVGDAFGSTLDSSYATDGGWIAFVRNESTSAMTFQTYAVCAEARIASPPAEAVDRPAGD